MDSSPNQAMEANLPRLNFFLGQDGNGPFENPWVMEDRSRLLALALQTVVDCTLAAPATLGA